MRVALPHLIRLMPRPSINHPLVDASRGTVRDERMPKHMPTLELLPLRSGKRRGERARGVIDGERHSVGVERVTARRIPHPCLHDRPQSRRHRDGSRRALPLRPLFFVNENRVRSEVEVVDLRPQDFAPSCPGVSGDQQHRKHEPAVALLPDEIEHFVNLHRREIQAIPQLRLFGFRQLVPGDLPFNFGFIRLLGGILRTDV